jgi:hypothetical protein
MSRFQLARWMMAAIALSLLMGACSSSSAKEEARLACIYGIPALPGQTASNETFGQELSNYKAAQVHAAKAAAADQRWAKLNDAYGTLVADMAQIVAVTGRNAKMAQPWQQQELRSQIDAQAGTQAENTVRSECAVANA